MYIKRSIPCALNSKQLAVIYRDLGRMINYQSSVREVAVASPRGLICHGWDELPEWVRSAEVRRSDGEVILGIDMVENIRSAEVDALFEHLSGRLASLVGYGVKPFPQRVFCIGWSKSGTSSLTEALRILGLFSWHTAQWVIGLKHRTDEIGLALLDFADIVDYTAVADLPVSALFKELDEAFPGSLFILTTRQTDAWIEGRLKTAANIIRYDGKLDALMEWAYGIETIDQDIFRDRFVRHQNEVLEYWLFA